MDGNDKEKVIDRIRKLMRLAESGNEHEAASAAAKATQLLQEYNLDRASVVLHESDEDNPIETLESKLTGANRKRKSRPAVRQDWVLGLLRSISRANFCYHYISSWNGSVYFVGRRQNAEVAQFVFETLYYQLLSLATARTKAYAQELKRTTGEDARFVYGETNSRVWRRSWLSGAVKEIARRLYEQTQQFELLTGQTGTTGKELITVRRLEVEQYIKEHQTFLVNTRSTSSGNFNSAAYSKGRQDGRQMNLPGKPAKISGRLKGG